MRKPAVVLMGLLGAMLCFGAVASAGVLSPTKVSAGVHKAKHPAYSYTTSGRISYPSQYCLPGTTGANYCVALTAKAVCSGRVSLAVKLGKDSLLASSNATIARASGKVSSTCTYSIKTKFAARLFTAKHRFVAHAKGASVRVSFAVKFLGNSVLNPRSAGTQTVGAKVLSP
ncbi:MAG: hypothetical protein M3071_10180 [Actinomycetota bacterium]|nr:hypothetical protein [Actinomycetota bacterium]